MATGPSSAKTWLQHYQKSVQLLEAYNKGIAARTLQQHTGMAILAEAQVEASLAQVMLATEARR